MTDVTTISPNPLHIAINLANQHSESPQQVVDRATAYHKFLTGTVATAKTAATPATAATATAAAATAATAPDPAIAAAKAAKAAAAAAVKAAAPTKPAATKPAVAGGGKPAAPAAAPAGNTKAPGGAHTQDEVRNMLRKVSITAGLGKPRAFEILAADGAGAANFGTLKPEFYDAVYEGCDVALNGGEGGAAGDMDALGLD